MARPKSEDKRNAILAAATQVFAERGIGAPTSAISDAAGVGEGTLFTYFKTKDELLNTLFREIKLELSDALMNGFPRRKSIRDRFHHLWHRYLDWGIANPLQRKVLMQIGVWSGLTEESKVTGTAPFAEILAMMEAAIEQHIMRKLPPQFVAGLFRAQAEITIEFMSQNPKQVELYRNAGFEVLWAGITRK